MNRRKFLMIAGGGTIIAAGTGIGGFIASSAPTRALKPWQDAGSAYSEPRKKALSYAILAPSPHNLQSWKVDLSDPTTIKILVDTNRLLPNTDPFSRQIIIGFGCFLEVLRMAAAQDGFRVDEELFPAGVENTELDTRPVAILRLYRDPQVKPDPLFRQILDRRSLKMPYDLSRPVTDESLTAIESATSARLEIGTANDSAMIENLRKQTREAIKIEANTARTHKESVDLLRIGKHEIEANPDGIALSGPLFEVLAMTGLFTREASLDPESTSFKQGMAREFEKTDTAMGYVWLTSKTNTREDQIVAGRDWVRINLATTALGVGTQPLSQPLQEYPEMAQSYQKIHKTLAPDGGTVQILARLGYGDNSSPTPRWGLAEKIMR